MGYLVASVLYWRPVGVVHRNVAGVGCSTFHCGSCLSRWSLRHLGPALQRQVLPPASYGMLCSKSQLAAGRRQPGAVQTSDAVKLSSRLGKFFRWCGEGDGFVVVLPGGQALVQAAEQAAEQVAFGGGVPVAGVFSPVVVGA